MERRKRTKRRSASFWLVMRKHRLHSLHPSKHERLLCVCVQSELNPILQTSLTSHHVKRLRRFVWLGGWRAYRKSDLVYWQGLGNAECTSLISATISGVSSTLQPSSTSCSCHSFVAPKTALATRGCLKTKAANNSFVRHTADLWL